MLIKRSVVDFLDQVSRSPGPAPDSSRYPAAQGLELEGSPDGATASLRYLLGEDMVEERWRVHPR